MKVCIKFIGALLVTLFALSTLLFSPVSTAQGDTAQFAQIQRAVDNLVRAQSAGLPGKVTWTLGAIDARMVLPACPGLEAFVPPGARLWGHANVGVRCAGSTPWTIYVPVTVRVLAQVAVAARPVSQGRLIESGDLAMQEADLGQMPGSVVTNAAEAVGRIATVSLAAGQPLRLDLLRSPPVVQQGQSVTLRVERPGFRVSADGRAVSTAADGQIAQVRTPSGQTVSGIARVGGVIELP